MRVAVIDLGTNTFNLNVSEIIDGTSKVLVEKKLPVKIGEGSISSRTLQSIPMERGFKTLKFYKSLIDEYKIDLVSGFATSAIRSCENGKEFIGKINKELGLNITIINGLTEASYIYKGVKNCVNWKNTALIVDLGGGSNEVIIANENEVIFSNSYNLGVSRLIQQFTLTDPLNKTQKDQLINHFSKTTLDLKEAVLKFRPKVLIGSSGTFETLSALQSSSTSKLDISRVDETILKVLKSDLQTKKSFVKMPEFRAEFIHLGFLFIQYILELFTPHEIHYSKFSLKEGVIFDMIKSKQL